MKFWLVRTNLDDDVLDDISDQLFISQMSHILHRYPIILHPGNPLGNVSNHVPCTFPYI